MSTKKIILISPAHPLRGGIAASTERLAQTLQQAGHEVVIYSFSLQYPSFLFPGKTQYTDDPPPVDLAIKTRLNSVNPFNWLTVGREIAQENPDHIIVRFWLPFMGPCLGTVLRVARFFSKKKFRVTGLVDNIIPHEKRPGDRLFAKYFVRTCDDFVVMSRKVGEEIGQFLLGSSPVTPTPDPTPTGRGGGDAIAVRSTSPLPVGVGSGVGVTHNIRYAPHPIYDNYGAPIEKSVARQQLDLPTDVPLVLFFGFIRKYKGLDLLLEALAQTPDIHAVVAGECYDDWDFYQKIIMEKSLGGRVHLFNDFIPAEQVRVFFSAVDLVVQPYKSATQSGISQIAYHFEKPMIVTNVGGLPEIVTHGVSGYVVPPESGAIAAAMRDFFKNKKATEMEAGVRAEKQRFSWEYLAEQLFG